MIIWIRNIILIILILTIIYAVLSFKARRQARDKLIGDYESSDKSENKEVYLRKGMRNYQRSYRSKLVLLIYFIPLSVVALLIYLANHT